MNESFVSNEVGVLILLAFACIGAIGLKRTKVPFSVGLVLIGALLGLLEPWMLSLQHLAASHDLILFVLVPPLIYASARHLDSRLFFRNLAPILTLAGPGLIVSTVIVGVMLSWLTPLSLTHALLFGALISASDPVAVLTLFEQLGVPSRLKMLVDGESLLNDATAIVAFNVVLGIIATGAWSAGVMGHALVSMISVLLGGALVGVVLGFLMKFVFRVSGENLVVQFTAAMIIAYFSFIIAEEFLHVSGVIAVLACGLVAGRYGADLLKTEVRSRLDDFWEYAAFVANSMIFLLVGLTTTRLISQPGEHLPGYVWSAIAWAIVAALVARGAMVFTLTPLINPFLKRGPISWPSQVISFWGGLRGAVALALALSLAGRFPDSDLLIAMTIGVAVFTIVVSGLTVGPLIHRLRLDQPEPLARLEEAQARVLARQEAMRRFAELEAKPFVSASALEELSELYAAQVREAERRLSTTWTELTAGEDVRRRAVWLQALQIENQKYREVYDEEILSVANSDRLKLMLNLKRDAILTSRFPLPYPTSETLESTLRERLIKKVAGVFPRSQWLQRQEDLSIQKHYEFDLAVARIAEGVSGQMVQLGRQLATETDRAAFEACSVWYATASRLAFDRMSVWKEQHPAQVLNILLRLAQRAVKASARNKLDKLVTGGVIGQNVAQKIRLEFDRGEGSQ